jgi:hypothetical protein
MMLWIMFYLFWPFVAGAAIFVWFVIVSNHIVRNGRIHFNFSLRGAILNVTAAALLLGFIKWASGQYYWQLNAVRAVLSEYPEIENIKILGNEDLWYEAELITFSVTGIPGATIIQIPHEAGKSEIRQMIASRMNLFKKKNAESKPVGLSPAGN